MFIFNVEYETHFNYWVRTMLIVDVESDTIHDTIQDVILNVSRIVLLVYDYNLGGL